MAELPLKLKPFNTPNFVMAETANKANYMKGGVHLRDVPADVLSDLCDEFRRNIFLKAEQADPNGK